MFPLPRFDLVRPSDWFVICNCCSGWQEFVHERTATPRSAQIISKSGTFFRFGSRPNPESGPLPFLAPGTTLHHTTHPCVPDPPSRNRSGGPAVRPIQAMGAAGGELLFLTQTMPDRRARYHIMPSTVTAGGMLGFSFRTTERVLPNVDLKLRALRLLKTRNNFSG